MDDDDARHRLAELETSYRLAVEALEETRRILGAQEDETWVKLQRLLALEHEWRTTGA